MHPKKLVENGYKSKVSIVKGENPIKMVKEAIQLMGGIESFIAPEEKVLIKPNLCTPKDAQTGATTDPEIVGAIIDLIQQQTTDVKIIESDGPATDAEMVWSHCGFFELAEEKNVTLINLSKEPTLRYYDYDLPEILFRNSAIVNVPKIKTNDITTVSVSLKNLFGLVPDRNRARYHRDIDRVIVDLNSIIESRLVVVDGLVGMEGDGPISGKPVTMNTVVAGNTPVSVDSVVCHIMGVNPFDVSHIKLATELGLGSMQIDSIEILGESLNKVQRKFRLPSSIKLQNKMKYQILEHSDNMILRRSLDALRWARRIISENSHQKKQ